MNTYRSGATHVRSGQLLSGFTETALSKGCAGPHFCPVMHKVMIYQLIDILSPFLRGLIFLLAWILIQLT